MSDQDGLAIFLYVEREQSAKAADSAEHFAATRGSEELRQRGFDLVSQVDIDTRYGVSLRFHLKAELMDKHEPEPRLKVGQWSVGVMG